MCWLAYMMNHRLLQRHAHWLMDRLLYLPIVVAAADVEQLKLWLIQDCHGSGLLFQRWRS
jgi:hypothetical protein